MDSKELITQAMELYKLGRFADAISIYDKIVELFPNNKDAYYLRGVANKDSGEYHRALDDFNSALSMDDNDYRAYCNKAIICERIGAYSEAVQAYRLFLKYAPPQYIDFVKFAEYRINELEESSGM